MVPFFFRSGGLEALGQDALVVRIGADISTREQLFDRFAVELGLPDYFGETGTLSMRHCAICIGSSRGAL